MVGSVCFNFGTDLWAAQALFKQYDDGKVSAELFLTYFIVRQHANMERIAEVDGPINKVHAANQCLTCLCFSTTMKTQIVFLYAL